MTGMSIGIRERFAKFAGEISVQELKIKRGFENLNLEMSSFATS